MVIFVGLVGKKIRHQNFIKIVGKFNSDMIGEEPRLTVCRVKAALFLVLSFFNVAMQICYLHFKDKYSILYRHYSNGSTTDHNDTCHIEIQRYYILHHDIQHNDTQHKNIRHKNK
jgi:hypothetical protein